MPTDPEYLKPRELAERWRVDVQTVYRSIKMGWLPALKLNPGCKRPHYRIRLVDVLACEHGLPPLEPLPTEESHGNREEAAPDPRSVLRR